MGRFRRPRPVSAFFPPARATQASHPHIHTAPAPTGNLHPSSFFPSFFLHLMCYLNKLKGLLLLLRGASLRRRLSWASGLKYCCHMSGASLLSPPWRVKRERTRQMTGVLSAAPATMAWPLE